MTILLVIGIIVLVLFVLIVFWIFVLGIISFIGGWYRASKIHSKIDIRSTMEEQYKFQSIIFNIFGNYRGCVTISIYPEGIELKTLKIFLLFHKPIFIHWNEIKNVNRINYLFYNGISVKTNSVKFFIFGSRSERIMEKFL